MLPQDPIAHWSQQRPQAIALRTPQAAWTWAQLEDAVRRASRFLEETVPAGATVLLQGWNDAHLIVLREAIYRSGLGYGAVSPQAAAPELRHLMTLTGASLLLAAPDMTVPEGVRALAWDAWENLPPDTTDLDPALRERARTLLFTSGTTGLPKACERPVAADAARMASMVKTFSLRAEQSHLVAAPLYHSGPTIFQRTHMALGSPTVLEPRFSATAVWAHVRDGRAQTAFFVPTHYHRLLREDPGGDASSIKTWWIAGAPAGAALKARIVERVGPGRLWEFLGSSETGTMAVMPPDGHLARPGSVGRPPAGVEVRILDDEGDELPVGESGLIYVRSGMLMRGYLGVDASAAQWRDGFLTVGDIGYADADGYVYLSDRRTDLILSGGVNVYPAEVEAVLAGVPGVHEACVVGEPDEEWGERVVAVLVAEPDVRDEDLDRHVRELLSPAKRPRRYVRRPEIPHNAIGKPLRAAVRASLEEPSSSQVD